MREDKVKTEILNLKETIIRLKERKKMLSQDLASTKTKVSELEKSIELSTQARVIVKLIAQQTQQKIEFRISNLVSLALASVFPDPYEFIARFETRRNQSECDLLFKKGDNEIDPLEASGFGACDIADFALKLSIWSLKPTRPTFILDEPFRNLSPDLQAKAGEMLKALSKLKSLSKDGIQFIIISHQEGVNIEADNVIEIKKSGDISQIVLEKQPIPEVVKGIKLRRKGI